MSNESVHVLCMTNQHKGDRLISALIDEGCEVILLLDETLRGEVWDDRVKEIIYTPDLGKYQDVINTVTWMARGWRIDLIFPLDEFEVELVSMLREHMRLPGMGLTQMRRFRDKLTMRDVAQEADIPIPPYTRILNYDELRAYMEEVEPPWMLKPRMEAGAMGIRKIHDSEGLWRALDELGDVQSYYLLEKFLPGDVFHVDTLSVNGKSAFVSYQKYANPPIDIYQGGGVFSTQTVKPRTKDARALKQMNEQIIRSLGIENGVTHAEFIKAHADGEFYFLEIAARVGGAFVSDMIEMASGINLWQEWARLEVATLKGEPYTLPEVKKDFAGLTLTLAHQEYPDTSAYNDPEVVWRASKPYHAGLIVTSDSYDRVDELVQSYIERFMVDFNTSAPPMGTQRTGQSG